MHHPADRPDRIELIVDKYEDSCRLMRQSMSAAMSTAQALRSLVGIPAEAGAKIEGRPPCRIGYQTMISESQTLPQQRVMSDHHDEDTCSCPQVSDRCGERGAGSGVSADDRYLSRFSDRTGQYLESFTECCTIYWIVCMVSRQSAVWPWLH